MNEWIKYWIKEQTNNDHEKEKWLLNKQRRKVEEKGSKERREINKGGDVHEWTGRKKKEERKEL